MTMPLSAVGVWMKLLSDYSAQSTVKNSKTEANHIIKKMQYFTVCDEKKTGYRIIKLIYCFLTNLGI